MNKNKDELENELDAFFEKIYSSKVCWEMSCDNRKWIEKNKCENKDMLVNSTLILPLPSKETLKVNLQIKGYAK